MKAGMLAAAALSVTASSVVLTALPQLSPFSVVMLSDSWQLAAALAATIACHLAARRSIGDLRRGWSLLTAGAGGWAFGQLVWTYYEVALRQEVPFPSLADLGFLTFPVAAAAGLLVWRGREGGLAGRGRDVIDGSIIAGSLLVISWVTALGSVVGEGGENWWSFALSVAYPASDVVLGTLVLLALARGTGLNRATLMLLAAGLGCLAVADSAYVYLVSVGGYSSADLVSAGWTAGFLLVAAGALHSALNSRERRRRSSLTSRDFELTRPSDLERELRPWRLQLVLPYIPLVVAGAALFESLLTATEPPVIQLALGVTLVSLVLIRQLLAMSENQRLLIELREAHSQVQHQVLHDHLTGLANRALFNDRVAQALKEPGAVVSVLFCDIDDFKNVNDSLGHEAGDTLLRLVAQRLQKCVRAGDTAARMGGDEFAVLLQDADDPEEVAKRVVSEIQQPYQLDDAQVRTSISVGLASQTNGDDLAPRGHRNITAGRRRHSPPIHEVIECPQLMTVQERSQILLRRADVAMYTAKAAGKGRVVTDEETTEPVAASAAGTST